MKTRIAGALWLLLAVPPGAPAQEAGDAAKPSFDEAAATARRQLEESVAELARLREEIAAEKIPLDRRVNDLESELKGVRADFQEASRALDNRTLDLSNLQSDILRWQEQETYLSNLLAEYARNFEAGLHIAEVRRYEEAIERAKLATENDNLPGAEVYRAQADLIVLSLGRLEEALGGARFEGAAVNASGLVEQGVFVMLGPAAFFRSADGRSVGTAQQRLGSLEPATIPFADPEDASAADRAIATGEGQLPVDPTLGNAHKIEATQESLWEHIRKGGPVMIPIIALAGAALLVALYKWVTLVSVRRPSKKRVRALLDAVARRDPAAVQAEAAGLRGPVGRMLAVGVQHIAEPRELIEEVMYETVLTTRLKLERFLPFIAISAASAPLLGLLGTVTGIITTFKLITVFGSGDVKTLSGGISEALITTEFGLIVAIPSLLLHAFLSRKARGIVGQMETAAVAFANQVSLASLAGTNGGGRREASGGSRDADPVIVPVGHGAWKGSDGDPVPDGEGAVRPKSG
jgi:biopolymer transport protein ExbB